MSEQLHQDPLTDTQIAEGFVKLALAVQQRSWRDANALGLSPTQVQIVMFLRQHAKGTAALHEVAHSLGLSAPTVSDAVRVLSNKGLLDKTRDPAQPRSLALKLTDMGRETSAQIAQWPSNLMQAVGTLNPTEQTVFVRGLSKMIRDMYQRGEIPVARLCVTCINFRPNRHDDTLAPHHCELLDAPLGDQHLRLDCAEHSEAPSEQRAQAWTRWLSADHLH